MSVRILTGDCREMLRTLADESVDCVVTSPPYWGLRDYGVEGQLGMERTLGEHVEVMASVFLEVRRVLKSTGTLWLNYGDSYAGSFGAQSKREGGGIQAIGLDRFGGNPISLTRNARALGLKPKDLCGIPWRVAFALQESGWWLRQDIIWSKPNPMPESVTDRCTKAHEYLFLLAKSERYYFDQEAVMEEAAPDSLARYEYGFGGAKSEALVEANKTGIGQRTRPVGKRSLHMRETQRNDGEHWREVDGGVAARGVRNKRSVWEVATAPFSEAHFATFPPALIEPCIKAGCPKGGTVLDPFFGAGTTGLVADRLGRNCIGIELNPAYVEIAQRRIKGDCPMFAEVA